MTERTCSMEGCDLPHEGRGMCRNHYRRWRYGTELPPPPTDEERLKAKIKILVSGCWEWTGSITESGYGRFALHGKTVRAHRYVYELLVGPIPEGLQLDHLCHTNDLTCVGGPACRHRRCVNPAHLEPVSHLENMRRGQTGSANKNKTHCVNNHPYDEANTGRTPEGWRYCRKCSALAAAARRALVQ